MGALARRLEQRFSLSHYTQHDLRVQIGMSGQCRDNEDDKFETKGCVLTAFPREDHHCTRRLISLILELPPLQLILGL